MINIMLVDDQEILRMVLKQSLEASGEVLIVAECSNGLEAVQSLEALDKSKTPKPHLILLDISMPIMDGIQASKEIKTRFPDIGILILTTENNEENLKKALEAGANAYIFKGAKTSEFIKKIQDLKNTKPIEASQKQLPLKPSRPHIFFIEGEEIELNVSEVKIISFLNGGKDLNDISKSLAMSKERVSKVIVGILKKLRLKNEEALTLFSAENNIK